MNGYYLRHSIETYRFLYVIRSYNNNLEENIGRIKISATIQQMAMTSVLENLTKLSTFTTMKDYYVKLLEAKLSL